MDFNLPVQSPNQSIYERFKPTHLALADQIAKQARQKNDLGGLMANAQMGLDVDAQEKAELEQRLADMSMQFTEATKDLDDKAYQEASAKFMEAQGMAPPQRQQAQLNNPNLAQSGFALLAAVLDPQNAAQIVSQPFNAQLQDQQVRQGQNDQAYVDQARAQQAQTNAAETKMIVEERKLGKAQNSQDRQAQNIRVAMGDIEKRIAKLDDRKQAAINQAYTGWNAANKPDEKITAGRRLQAALKGTGLEPTDEEIQNAAQGLMAENSRYAAQEWENALKNESLFGEIPEERAKDFENQRLAIAKRYGIDPQNLRAVPTGKTIAAQKLALAQDQFSFLKTKTADDFKLKWANLQVAKQRAQTYAQAVANGYSLGSVRNQISAGHLAAREFEASIKSAGKSVKSQLQGYIDKLKVESDPEKAAKIRADMNLFIQNTAQEFGMTPQEVMANPLKAMDTFMKSLDEQEEEIQYNPEKDQFAGEIPGSTKPISLPVPGSAKPNPKTKPKAATKKPGVPKGWGWSG